MVKVKQNDLQQLKKFACVLFCIIMSIISVKCTKIQYLQFCVCAENVIYSFKNPQNCCHQSCFFGPDMHRIICRQGLRHRLDWGSLQRSPRLPSYFRGAPRGRGRRKGRRKGRGRKRKGGKKGEERGGDERESWTPRIFRWIEKSSVYRVIDH